MEYNNFLERVKETVQKNMGEEYMISITHVKKNNGIGLDGILITRKGSMISPAFYLNDQYQAVQKGKSIAAVAAEVAAIYQKSSVPSGLNLDFFESYQKMKGRVLFKLVHYDKNKELLQEIPHLRFLDLAVVFYCDISNVERHYGEQIENGTILLYHSHLQRWRITLEELQQDAVRNTPKVYPAVIQTMEEVMRELFTEQWEESGSTTEADEDFLAEGHFPAAENRTEENGVQPSAGRTKMYVLSNSHKLFGAAAVLYPDVLSRFANRLSVNLYLLPSSVHEMILLPDDGSQDREELRKMVGEINDTQVEPEEVLADSVYYFDRIKEKLDIL